MISWIRDLGAWWATALLVVGINTIALVMDVTIHQIWGARLEGTFVLFDVLIATPIALPISYALFKALIALDKQKSELALAIDKVRKLEGLLPMCASCKAIRDVSGNWRSADDYIQHNTDANVSHGFCPSCAKAVMDNNPSGAN